MKRIQKITWFFALVLGFFGLMHQAYAQQKADKEQNPCRFTNLTFDIFPASNTGTSEYNPDYAWRCSKYLAGGGFVELGKDRLTFTNNNVRVKPLPKKFPFFEWRTEFGGNRNGPYLQTGPQFNLQTTPVIKKIVAPIFKNLAVSREVKLAGYRGPNETLFVWRTQNLKLGNFNLWSEGFQRVRGGNRRDYGQPMVLLEPPWLKRKTAFAIEIENFGSGKKPNILFGIRIHN